MMYLKKIIFTISMLSDILFITNFIILIQFFSYNALINLIAKPKVLFWLFIINIFLDKLEYKYLKNQISTKKTITVITIITIYILIQFTLLIKIMYVNSNIQKGKDLIKSHLVKTIDKEETSHIKIKLTSYRDNCPDLCEDIPIWFYEVQCTDGTHIISLNSSLDKIILDN